MYKYKFSIGDKVRLNRSYFEAIRRDDYDKVCIGIIEKIDHKLNLIDVVWIKIKNRDNAEILIPGYNPDKLEKINKKNIQKLIMRYTNE